jgi:NAD(P)-dependent dehydrogenase (short-subunit alcohol dehydrogenase family)
MRPVRAVAQAEDALPMSSPSDRRRGVVAGAGSGIGKAAALRLVSEGVDVLAVDINRDSLSELESAGCKTLAGDVADPLVRSQVADWAHGANYLVNSAGVIVIKPIFEVTVEEWRRMQTVNAEATFFLCQKIGPRLAPGGAIVNLSSSSAKLATTVEVAAYAASKTTILSITRSFAYALSSRPVRVNAILPGIVDTSMQDEVLEKVAPLRGLSPQELHDARTKLVPLGRGSSPEECAGLIWFLLSDESAYMTGQAINFTGGLVTW